MKSQLYILSAVLLILVSCSSTRNSASREMRKVLKQGEVKYAVESNRYIIKVNRMRARRGMTVHMKPSFNFIIIDGGHARMSLGYVGRSFDTRGISAINMSGQIIKQEVILRNKGGFNVDMKIKQDNDVFRVRIRIGQDGYCNLDINHPRLDLASYNGTLMALK
jgi:hypothetical protein